MEGFGKKRQLSHRPSSEVSLRPPKRWRCLFLIILADGQDVAGATAAAAGVRRRFERGAGEGRRERVRFLSWALPFCATHRIACVVVVVERAVLTSFFLSQRRYHTVFRHENSYN